MVKVKLTGLPEELDKLLEKLRATCRVLYESAVTACGTSAYVKCYVELQA